MTENHLPGWNVERMTEELAKRGVSWAREELATTGQIVQEIRDGHAARVLPMPESRRASAAVREQGWTAYNERTGNIEPVPDHLRFEQENSAWEQRLARNPELAAAVARHPVSHLGQ